MTTTESRSAWFAEIETWPTERLVEGIVSDQQDALNAVILASDRIAWTVDTIVRRLEAGGRLIYLGAGTSGRIGAQDAAELPPTFSWPYERAITLMAGGPGALQRAVENAEDSTTAAAESLDQLGLIANDVVIGLAASGSTPYVVGGLTHARDKGALTIGIINNPGGKVGAAAEIEILLDTGPEFLAGSTRLKAGTAQKIALNAISTAVMIRLGYVYGGLMVEMRPTNAKLRERAVRIVAELAGTDEDTAQRTLEEAGLIKVAVIMLKLRLSKADAEAALGKAGGNVRRALA